MRLTQKGSPDGTSARHPDRVIADAYKHSTAATLVLRIPRHVAEHPERGNNFALIACANIIARRMTEGLAAGLSVEKAAGDLQVSGEWLSRELRKGHVVRDERTCRRYVHDLLEWGSLVRVARVPTGATLVQRHGEDRVAHKLVNVVALAEVVERVRRFGRDIFGRLRLPRRSLAHSLFPASKLNTDIRRRERTRGALDYAIRNASPGCRSRHCHWLACTLRKAGVGQEEAEGLVREFWDVHQGRGFRWADARGDLRHAYRSNRIEVEEETR